MNLEAVLSGVDFSAIYANVAVFGTSQVADQTLHFGR